MAYNPTEWATGDIITAQKLNKMEQGIAGAGLQLYGPYFASGTATAAAGYKTTITCSSLEDENGVSVVFPEGSAALFLIHAGVSLGNPNTPAAIKEFYLPYVYDGQWQNGSIALDNTTESEASATGSIAFYSSVEFPEL